MFTLYDDGYYRVPEWTSYEWLEHGFGTRNAEAPSHLALVRQIHSADVAIADRVGSIGTADALLCGVPGIAVGIRTADCFPILLVDPVNKSVAAVHAGWRGAAQHIAAKAILAMNREFGTNAANLEAAIGPGIGLSCFEVGPEVARQFGNYESEEKTHLDLQEIIYQQLTSAHVSKIYKANACTYTEALTYYSFRREGELAGRMISYAKVN